MDLLYQIYRYEGVESVISLLAPMTLVHLCIWKW